MESSSDLPYDALETLRIDGVGFIDLVTEHDPATPVPTCPGWTLADLADHQGEVWHFWGRIVAEGITERGRLKTIRQIERPDGPLMVDWLALTHNELFSALVDAGTAAGGLDVDGQEPRHRVGAPSNGPGDRRASFRRSTRCG